MEYMYSRIPVEDLKVHALSMVDMFANSLYNFDCETYSSSVKASRLTAASFTGLTPMPSIPEQTRRRLLDIQLTQVKNIYSLRPKISFQYTKSHSLTVYFLQNDSFTIRPFLVNASLSFVIISLIKGKMVILIHYTSLVI